MTTAFSHVRFWGLLGQVCIAVLDDDRLAINTAERFESIKEWIDSCPIIGRKSSTPIRRMRFGRCACAASGPRWSAP